jgi:hypothetical protein
MLRSRIRLSRSYPLPNDCSPILSPHQTSRTILLYSKNELGAVTNHAWLVRGGGQKSAGLQLASATITPAALSDVIHSDQEKADIGELEEVDSAADAWQQLWAPSTPWFSNSSDSGVGESWTGHVDGRENLG